MVMDETGWAQDTQMTGGLAQAKTVFFPGVLMSDFPVVACSGDVGTFAQVSAASGGVNIRVSRMTNSPAIQVTIYLFSKRPPPDPGMGYALYNNGQIVFSILTPIMKPVGTFDNNGYSGVDLTGRTCAHLPQLRSQSSSVLYQSGGLGSCLGPQGQPQYQILSTSQWQAQMVKCNGSSVSVDTKSRSVGPIPYICTASPQAYTGSNQTSAPNYKSLIIDVTNF